MGGFSRCWSLFVAGCVVSVLLCRFCVVVSFPHFRCHCYVVMAVVKKADTTNFDRSLTWVKAVSKYM